MSNPNNNCLAGMSCPNCGSYGPFKIECASWFTVHDDGTDQHSDVSWDDESLCSCKSCDYGGTVEDFKNDPLTT